MDRVWRKGSFTIEASILIPFILFLMMQILQMGISFYQESVTRNLVQKESSFDAVLVFYRLQVTDQIKEEVFDEQP